MSSYVHLVTTVRSSWGDSGCLSRRRRPVHESWNTTNALSVIDIGSLDLTHAVCMADLGPDMVAIDVDEGKLGLAAKGEPLLRAGPRAASSYEP